MSKKFSFIKTHGDTLTILGSILASSIFLLTRIDSIESRMNDQIAKQSARSDRLYEMFIDLLREGK